MGSTDSGPLTAFLLLPAVSGTEHSEAAAHPRGGLLSLGRSIDTPGRPMRARWTSRRSGPPLAATIVVEAVPTRVHPEELSLRLASIEPADQQALTAVVATHLGGRD